MANSNSRKSVPNGWYQKRLEELESKKADEKFVKQGYVYLSDKIQDLTDQTRDLDKSVEALSREVTGVHILEGNLAEMKSAVETNARSIRTIYKWHSKLLASVVALIIGSAGISIWYQTRLSDSNLVHIKKVSAQVQSTSHEIKQNGHTEPVVPVSYIKGLVEDASAQAARRAVSEMSTQFKPKKRRSQ